MSQSSDKIRSFYELVYTLHLLWQMTLYHVTYCTVITVTKWHTVFDGYANSMSRIYLSCAMLYFLNLL